MLICIIIIIYSKFLLKVFPLKFAMSAKNVANTSVRKNFKVESFALWPQKSGVIHTAKRPSVVILNFSTLGMPLNQTY